MNRDDCETSEMRIKLRNLWQSVDTCEDETGGERVLEMKSGFGLWCYFGCLMQLLMEKLVKEENEEMLVVGVGLWYEEGTKWKWKQLIWLITNENIKSLWISFGGAMIE